MDAECLRIHRDIDRFEADLPESLTDDGLTGLLMTEHRGLLHESLEDGGHPGRFVRDRLGESRPSSVSSGTKEAPGGTRLLAPDG